MSDLLARLRQLQPEKESNATLLDLLDAAITHNEELSRQILGLLDQQDALAAVHERITNTLLARQGKQRPEPTLPENTLEETPLRDAWNS